jgi:hypothetical protein
MPTTRPESPSQRTDRRLAWGQVGVRLLGQSVRAGLGRIGWHTFRHTYSTDAQGLRIWLVPQAAAGAQTSPPSSFNDQWCSDELGVVVLQVFVSGGTHKNETLLQNIERREPDPALFEIPPDYTILERVPEGNRPQLLRPLPTPSAPSHPQ